MAEASADGFVLVPAPGEGDDSASQTPAARGAPVQAADWQGYFDADGRIVQESALRKAIFRGGMAPELRKEVWKFILGFFPFASTTRERDVISKERAIDYVALKERWKEALAPEEEFEALSDPELQDDQYQFMYIQAKCNAMRHVIDEDLARKNMKAIKKDVPRTDRKGEYFGGEDNPHLVWLHDVLVTYAVFHPEVGYAQGMNDVLSMIMTVMDNEGESYWCFATYMETIQADFMSVGMMAKLDQLIELLVIMDPELLDHFKAAEAGDLVFCHRWLLLSFKREFSERDAISLFEILCSHHLELSSTEAEKARGEALRKEREIELSGDAIEPVADGKLNVQESTVDTTFTFELFVCIAILQKYKADLMKCHDVAEIFTFITGLVEHMDLDVILTKAEAVFFAYCRKSVRKADAAYLLRAD